MRGFEMLIFEEISYKNLLSSGNMWVKITLNQHAKTLIVGKNGAGKSTLRDAISFALYGRPMRKATKAQMVNSRNGSETMVKLSFRKNNVPYVVERGINPDVFNIYENGTLIPKPDDLKYYKEKLEKTILGFNYNTLHKSSDWVRLRTPRSWSSPRPNVGS